MSSPLVRLKEIFAARATREFLAWCLPALLIGFALRLTLTIQLPYAYFHDDTPDFLTTPYEWLGWHNFEIHGKKTFLVPVLYTLMFALPIPAAITIPIVQHAMGLGLILMVGGLCRLWFETWKIWIVPLTILAAINPFLLWYEHTLMAETTFVCATVLVALAGTLYTRRATWWRFALLAVALVVVAGARPEGKLLFGFGLFLAVLVHWRKWAALAVRVAILATIALFVHRSTKSSQAGLLLYTSVARLTPPDLKCAPGFEPYIAPVRNYLQSYWDEHPRFPRVRDRKAISAAVKRYLSERGGEKRKTSSDTSNEFCLKLARETCLRNLPALPGLTLIKFRLAARKTPAGLFDNTLFFHEQRIAYALEPERVMRLAPGLLGAELRDHGALDRWIDTHYAEVPWFNVLATRWLATVNHLHLPDTPYPDYLFLGVPLYFLAGALGLLAIMFRRGNLQRFHVAWGLTLLGFFFVIMLTANVRPRFRFVFEPFWFLNAALLAECLWLSLRGLFRRRGHAAGDAAPDGEAPQQQH